MNCSRCGKEIEKSLVAEKLCSACFVELMENRARKALSRQNLKKGDKILIVDDCSKEFVVGEYLFKKIMEKVPLEITIRKKEGIDLEKAQKEYTAIILPRDMDDEAESLISAMINNKPLPKDRVINVLEKVYDGEVRIFAGIKKLKYAEEQEKSPINVALDKLERLHPQSKFAIVQSLKAMKKK